MKDDSFMSLAIEVILVRTLKLPLKEVFGKELGKLIASIEEDGCSCLL